LNEGILVRLYRLQKIAIPEFHYSIGLIVFLGLVGCTGNIRKESSSSIAQSVTHTSMPGGEGLAWVGPELQVQHFRTLFYGHDTVYYRLAAREPSTTPGIPVYHMLIDAHYGGNLRHYDVVKFADGTLRPTADHQHGAERCQFFNNLVYACLFRDQVSLSLSRSELEDARANGLQFTLSSGTQDYERIELPANYVQGFLQAVR